MLVEVLPDAEALAERGAVIVAALVADNPDSVLGFATGSTPLGVYDRLIEMHRREGLSGASKAEGINATLEGPITAMVPATMVQLHPHAHVLIDAAAASALAYRHHDGVAEPI